MICYGATSFSYDLGQFRIPRTQFEARATQKLVKGPKGMQNNARSYAKYLASNKTKTEALVRSLSGILAPVAFNQGPNASDSDTTSHIRTWHL